MYSTFIQHRVCKEVSDAKPEVACFTNYHSACSAIQSHNQSFITEKNLK